MAERWGALRWRTYHILDEVAGGVRLDVNSTHRRCAPSELEQAVLHEQVDGAGYGKALTVVVRGGAATVMSFRVSKTDSKQNREKYRHFTSP